MHIDFTNKLIEWHENQNKRIMPWKGEKDPYRIWISEIILQQTRVMQGLSYYNKFIDKFPDIRALALANDEDVFKVWEGLGYYSRCRNILVTARFIYYELDNKFPTDYENMLKLKGIGPYTAAAISSFAYGLPHAVVDGNVFRVLSRFFGEALPIDSTKGKQYFTALANQLLYLKDTSAYNQSIMDFGATVCKPQIPDCKMCVFKKDCQAYLQGMVNQLPVKEKVIKKHKRYFTYFVFTIADSFLVKKRAEKDIWQGLYEFYLFETAKEAEWQPKQIKKWLADQLEVKEYLLINISEPLTQQLTHQHLRGRFVHIQLHQVPVSLNRFLAVSNEKLLTLSFPRFINQYLQQMPLVYSNAEI